MRILHFTSNEGEPEGEYVVFVEDDDEFADDPGAYEEDGYGFLTSTWISGDGLAIVLGQPYFLEKQT